MSFKVPYQFIADVARRASEQLTRNFSEIERFFARLLKYVDPDVYNAAAGTGTGNAVTGAFVFMPGPPQMAFTKEFSDTDLIVRMHVSCFRTTNTGLVEVGVYDGTTEYDVCHFFFNDLSNHRAFGGALRIAGLADGDYTFTGIWRQAAAEMNMNSDDWISIEIREVPAE